MTSTPTASAGAEVYNMMMMSRSPVSQWRGVICAGQFVNTVTCSSDRTGPTMDNTTYTRGQYITDDSASLKRPTSQLSSERLFIQIPLSTNINQFVPKPPGFQQNTLASDESWPSK